MNILFCHAGKPHPKALAAAKKYAPGVKIMDTSGSDFAYWEAIAEHWKGEEDLVLIEQDIEINPYVIASFDTCEHDWCSYRYSAPGVFNWSLAESLGCTKFSANAQRLVPADDIAGSTLTIWAGHKIPSHGRIVWDRIDWRISTHLKASQFAVHVHGNVKHYHPYPATHVNKIVQEAVDAYLGKPTEENLKVVQHALDLAASGELNANPEGIGI